MVRRDGPIAGARRVLRLARARRESRAMAGLFPAHARGPLPFQEIAGVFSQFEVCLNFSNVWADGQPGSTLIPHVRLRDFEAPMCRTCYLTGHTDEIAAFYEIGQEIDTYRTPERADRQGALLPRASRRGRRDSRGRISPGAARSHVAAPFRSDYSRRVGPVMTVAAPLFSVIIPTYNRAALVADALDSVWAQRCTDFEVIAADDGSTDATIEVLETHGDRLRSIGRRTADRASRATPATVTRVAGTWHSSTATTSGSPGRWRHTPRSATAITAGPDCGHADRVRRSRRPCGRSNARRRAPNRFRTTTPQDEDWRWYGASAFVINPTRSGRWTGSPTSGSTAKTPTSPCGSATAGFIHVTAPSTFGYRTHPESAMANFDRTMSGAWRMVDQETAGEYPGGSSRAPARRQILGRHLRSVMLDSLSRHRFQDGWRLYKATFGWHVSLGALAVSLRLPGPRPAEPRPLMKSQVKAGLKALHLYRPASQAWIALEPRLIRLVRSVTGENQRLIERYLSAHPVAKLHIGCGGNQLAGWLNTELCPRGDEVFLDATRPFPFDDHTFALIYSEHMIEHIPYGSAAHMVRECFRVLEPGGTIRLVTPNLAFLRSLLEGPPDPHRRRRTSSSTRDTIELPASRPPPTSSTISCARGAISSSMTAPRCRSCSRAPGLAPSRNRRCRARAILCLRGWPRPIACRPECSRWNRW